METLDQTDVSEDIVVPVGVDLQWSFSLEPWDATGTTATFVVTPPGSSFAMTVSVVQEADDAVSTYAVHINPTQLGVLGLATPGATASYAVRWLAGDGTVWALGHGTILVPQ